MDAKQRLYFALGELVCAMAQADGKLHQEERNELHRIVQEETAKIGLDAEVATIIFELIGRDQRNDMERTYRWALNEMKLVRHLIDPPLKTKLVTFMTRVAKAHDSITTGEHALLGRFQNDLKTL